MTDIDAADAKVWVLVRVCWASFGWLSHPHVMIVVATLLVGLVALALRPDQCVLLFWRCWYE